MYSEIKTNPNYYIVEELSKQLRCSRSMHLHLEQLFVFCEIADINFTSCLDKCKNGLDLWEFSKQESILFLEKLEREIISRF